MANVLIAERNLLLREGVKGLLSRARDFDVVAEASNHAELFSELGSCNIDVLLLDPHLDGARGEWLIRRVRSRAPRVPILGFSDMDELHFGSRAIRAGLRGYINKKCGAEEFLHAIGRVSEGRAYISLAMAEQLVSNLKGVQAAQTHLLLTAREQDIFRRLVAGEKIGQIASELFLSAKTVSTHKVRLLHKMGMLEVSQLVRYAVTHHLL